MLKLKNFEDNLPEVILKRGLAYYNKELVIDFEEVDDALWEAEVTGSEIIIVVEQRSAFI